MAGQLTQLQKETTEGTAATSAMKKIASMRMIPAFDGTVEPYRGLTGKVATSGILTDLTGRWSVTGSSDFNSIGYVAASRISAPTTTTPGGGTNSRQHKFTLNPNAADTRQTYTAQFGDTTKAQQGVFGLFQSLGIEVERGNLGFSSSFQSREPTIIASITTAGVTTVAAQPIPPKNFDVWADDTWATIGVTKLLGCYRMNLGMGDKFIPDAPINSAVSSYEGMLEQEDQGYDFDAQFGFDATAESLVTTFKNGAIKYFRIKAIGPIIEAAITYSVQVDFAALITSVGEVTTAPNGAAIVLPMDLTLASDGTNALEMTVVNALLNLN